MKRKTKLGLITLGALAGVFALSGCTANFCSEKDRAHLIYAFDPGVTQFYHKDDAKVATLHETDVVESETEHKQYYKSTVTGRDDIVVYIEYDTSTKHYSHQENTYHVETKFDINTIIDSAKNIGTYVPTFDFFKEFDAKFYNSVDFSELTYAGETGEEKTKEIRNFFNQTGYTKFYGNSKRWGAYDETITSFRNGDSGLNLEKCPSDDFIKLYKSQLNAITDSYRSCITTSGGKYGSYGMDKFAIDIEAKSWGEAWKGGHIIEGLVVYPVAWLLDSFANLFSGNNVDAFKTGVPQILSLLVVTIIVRLFLFLVTIKSTFDQTKMTALQPELAKIQQKYPNSNTNDAQKQRLAEEQMRLYKKHGVNPLSTLLVLIVQFPLFIGVWGAMQGSAMLSTGTFLGLDLSQPIWDCLKIGPTKFNPGWVTALVLIILMSAGQFFQMKVPQWLQKARTKKVSRLGKNPAEKSQNRTANIVSWVMLIMIIFMGFTLPAAMGVYWFIGALVSLAQSTIMHIVTGKKQAR